MIYLFLISQLLSTILCADIQLISTEAEFIRIIDNKNVVIIFGDNKWYVVF